MSGCMCEFAMIIIIVFVYFLFVFDSTCCVTWESIGIVFFFSFMKCISTVMSGIVCALSLSCCSREKVSAQKRVRLMILSIRMWVSISERVKSNWIRSKWRRLLWFWMCVCVLEKLSSRFVFNPFRFLTCFFFCLLLLVVLFSLHIVCFVVYFLFINV